MFLTYCAVSKQLNNVPNLQARNLKKQTSTTIGVLLPSVSNPFYPSILRGIEDEAVSNNYAVLFASCDRKQSDTDRYLQDMLEHNVRGIITLFLEYLPEAASLYTRHGGRRICCSGLMPQATQRDRNRQLGGHRSGE